MHSNDSTMRHRVRHSSGEIACSIFQKQETVIQDLTDKINKAENVQQKAKLAEELQKQVEAVLSCPDYDKRKLECENCHFIENMRKQTARLIIKAGRLP